MAPKLEMSPYPISSIKIITMLGVLEFSFSEQEKRSREKRVRYMIEFFIFFCFKSLIKLGVELFEFLTKNFYVFNSSSAYPTPVIVWWKWSSD